jgi:hypothetical protein
MTTEAILADSSFTKVAEEKHALAVRAQRVRRIHRASLLLPAAGIAAGAWLLARGPASRAAGVAALGASLGVGLARWQLQRLVTESIPYTVQMRLGEIEVRRYPPQIWAETVVEGSSWKDALNEGFGRLAAYIFGANGESARLTMTAPVFSSYAASDGDAQLEMTAPLPAAVGGANERRDHPVAFVMPADRDLDSLPAPRDRRVRLRELPPRRVAALRFRGNYETSLPYRKRDELLQRLREAGLSWHGEPRFAGYDPPSTWSALRRNEVLIELTEPFVPHGGRR